MVFVLGIRGYNQNLYSELLITVQVLLITNACYTYAENILRIIYQELILRLSYMLGICLTEAEYAFKH